ncbi:hypothetical protein MMC16_005636 [Acarospora aff. strigata]|nr:hypothetical protein [Acarospora aff. strigata]
MPSTAAAKPKLPALKTPVSATLPSELPRSPIPGWTNIIKLEDDIKTPITPPTAYTEFLKALSPAVSTPATGASFGDNKYSGKSTPTSQPSTASSGCSCSCENHKSPTSAVPPSPFLNPKSARTPTGLRRLRIPQSPVYSPATDSPLSAAVRSPFSPTAWAIDGKTRYFDAPRTGGHRPVSVKQVVTRTVTYTRTPLEPAPRGKRRRVGCTSRLS